MPSAKYARLAFTLIEMLVVISITAVILSLLIPSVMKAREEGYKAVCLSNMRQQGIALVGYAMSWKNSIPPNASKIDGIDNNGPYQIVGSHFCYAMHSTGGINGARVDNSGPSGAPIPVMGWTNGLGLLWAGDFIPYTLAGARILWCPANKTEDFYGKDAGAANPIQSAPGRRWSSLKDNPYTCISGTNGGAQTASFGYGYRSLGGPNNYSKGKWDIALMANYVATVDVCANIYGNTQAFSVKRPNYSHGRALGAYTGVNRLWYDGHAKWLYDPQVRWEAYNSAIGTLAHDTGFSNTGYYSFSGPNGTMSGNAALENFWRIYDAN